MFRNTLLLLFILVLAACSQEPQEMTIEEKVLTSSFTSLQIALIYDEECNGKDPKDRFDLDKKENVNLIGNEQLLAGRIGGMQHLRSPNASVEDLVKKLVKASRIIKENARASFREKGCDAPEVKAVQKTLDLFSQALPAQIFHMVNNEIVKQGGTVTSMAEIEAAGKLKSEKDDEKSDE